MPAHASKQRSTALGEPRMSLSLAVLLREHRLAAGLTQAKLAELAGLSTRAIQHLEAGLGQPYAESARRLAEGLALDPVARVAFETAARATPRRTARRAEHFDAFVCHAARTRRPSTRL
jgi:transcriptional regulator with XRE-family HTH domain